MINKVTKLPLGTYGLWIISSANTTYAYNDMMGTGHWHDDNMTWSEHLEGMEWNYVGHVGVCTYVQW